MVQVNTHGLSRARTVWATTRDHGPFIGPTKLGVQHMPLCLLTGFSEPKALIRLTYFGDQDNHTLTYIF
jgi:hypothetical protein